MTNFRPEGSDHRPCVKARLGYDDDSLRGIFRVEDQYVRAVHTGFQQSVCRDSCVEFFFQPGGGGPYLNFEFSAGGAMLCHCVRDNTRVTGGFKDMTVLSDDECRQVQIVTSLPAIVEPEITEPVTWTLAFAIPLAVVANYTEVSRPLSGQTWRANFYKCADESSHNHWGSWMPVAQLNFHLPECFGPIVFE